jgi:hypothetical protein
MKQILKSKVIVISNSVNMNKKKRIKKPWWNDNLTYLVTAKNIFTSYLMNSVFEASDVSNEDNDGRICSSQYNKE